jgi:TatD DNase family protein
MRPPIIDTHAHIFLPQFRDDFQFVLDRAADIGVTDIVMPCIVPDSLEQMRALPSDVRIKLHQTSGIHPCDVATMNTSDAIRNWLEATAFAKEIVAIGETGLDYYWSTEHVVLQKDSLRHHIQVAKECGKPVILHNRNATTDLLQLVSEAQDGRLRGVWHCFTGTYEEGRLALDLGLHLGIGGVVTYKNGQIDKYIAQFPLERLLLETDSPYLSPSPNRSKRNEPCNLTFVIATLSRLFDVSEDEIRSQTTVSAKELFGLS